MKRSSAKVTLAISLLGMLCFFQNCGKPMGHSLQYSASSVGLADENVSQMTVHATLSTMPASNLILHSISLVVTGDGMIPLTTEWVPQSPTDLPPSSYTLAVDKGLNRVVVVQVEFRDPTNVAVVYSGDMLINSLHDDDYDATVNLVQIY